MRSENSTQGGRIPAYAAGCVAASVVVIAIAAHAGIPAYRHDWHWPPFDSMLRTWCASKLYAWDWQGLGGPNIAIQVHPYFALIAALSYLLPSKAILTACLGASAGISAAGMVLLAQRLYNASPPASTCAALMYALAPFTVDEMVAGHVEILVACAAIPWVVLASQMTTRVSPWLFSAALAWTAFHVQFLLFSIILVLCISGLRPFRLAGVTNGLALLTTMPYAWGILRPAARSIVHAMQTTLPWLATQSTSAVHAVQGAGYFRAYWETAASSVPGALVFGWVYPAAIAAALAFGPRSSAARLLVPYAIGVFWLAGLTSRLGVPIGWLAQHVFAASVFRELHHAAILVAFAASLSAAIALSRVRWSALSYSIACGVTLLAAGPYLSGSVMNQVGSFEADSSVSSFLQLIAGSQQTTRFYLAPGFNPAGPAYTPYVGVDPLAYPVGNALPFWTYTPHALEPSIIWAIEDGGLGARDTTRVFGISWIVKRNRYGSGLHLNVPYHLPRPVREFGGSPALPQGWREIPIDRPSSGQAVFSYAKSKNSTGIVLLLPSSPGDSLMSDDNGARFNLVRGADVNAQWTPAADWWFLDRELAVVADRGAFTFARVSRLQIECNARASSHDVRFWGNGLVYGHRIASGGVVVSGVCGGVETRVGQGGFLAAVPEPGNRSWRAQGMSWLEKSPVLTWSSLVRTGDVLSMTASHRCGRCNVALTVARDDGWKLSIDGGPAKSPALCCPDINLWQVDLPQYARLKIWYDPDTTALLLDGVAAGAWLFLVGGALMSQRKKYAR